MKISVMTDILEANDRIASASRSLFDKNRNLVINLMSAPGAGKTALLERTAAALEGKLRLGIVVGDVESTYDSERLEGYHLPVVQLNTGAACHLDANMVASALPHLDLSQIEVLIIENVGNLVCPAEFKVGEDYKVMMLSVTEGAEKPLKYPLMFRESSLLLLNKIDLLPYVDFSVEDAKRNARRVNPDIEIIEISCTTGQGIDSWVSWLVERNHRKRQSA